MKKNGFRLLFVVAILLSLLLQANAAKI